MGDRVPVLTQVVVVDAELRQRAADIMTPHLEVIGPPSGASVEPQYVLEPVWRMINQRSLT